MSFLGARRTIVVAAASALALSLVAGACGSDGTTSQPSRTTGATGATTATSIDAGSPTTSGGSATTSPPATSAASGDDGDTTSNAPSGPLPDVPTGSFLSSHRLSVSGDGGLPTDARSVCHTSPGATCVIDFTMGGTTKSLAAQPVDASGTTAWDWSPSDIGLTPGHWEVRIVAENAAGRQSVDEAIGLDVVA